MSRDSAALHGQRSLVTSTADAHTGVRHGKASWPGTRTRVLVLASRQEASRLARNPFVLAGLATSAWLIWLNNRTLDLPVAEYGLGQPGFWWATDVSIVACLLTAAGGVLVASQLAASRARRDSMEQLYASYPTPAALRTGAHLLSVTSPVMLVAALTAGAVAWLDRQGTLGSPRLWVLAAGLLLICLAGSIGVALGSWRQHPLSGLLTVLVLGLIEIDLVLSFSNPIHLPGGTAWLFPWSSPGSLLNSLPGLTVPYPPPAHLAELAGLIVLAVVASLWPVLARRRVAAVLAVAGIGVTCWSGWLEARPVSPAVLATMGREVTQPGDFQRCQLTRNVRYCYYPAFRPLVRQWAIPVDGVLARLPRVSRPVLTVRQVWDLGFFMPPLLSPTGLTSNGSPPPTRLVMTVGDFQQALPTDPGLVSGTSVPPVYTDASWSTGTNLGAAQFGLAVSTAEWATGLATTGRRVSYNYAIPGGGGAGGIVVLACVPVGQARQSIALWLAAGATAATRSAFAGTGSAASTQVGKQWVATVTEPGSGPSVGLVATAQGAALAAEMMRLPDRRVEAVLGARWRFWISPRATTADLAAALGLRLPRQPKARPDLPYTKGNTTYGNYTPPTQICR
jgi:hypothetical protein